MFCRKSEIRKIDKTSKLLKLLWYYWDWDCRYVDDESIPVISSNRFQLMSRCWKQRMNERPAFKELAEIFETMMKKSVVIRILIHFEDIDVHNIIISGGSRGARDTPWAKILYFHAVFSKNWSKRRLAPFPLRGWRPREIMVSSQIISEMKGHKLHNYMFFIVYTSGISGPEYGSRAKSHSRWWSVRFATRR